MLVRPYGRTGVRFKKMVSAKTIAVFNHKGGVGKTTTAVNLGACLAREHGKRVLVVDMDPQANATRALLASEPAENCATLRDVLLADSGSGGPGVADVCVNTEVSGLCVAPSSLALSEVEFKLVHRMGREQILREALEGVRPLFDFILVDCPPSMGLLALNGLAASDSVIIPTETQFLSLRGLRDVLDVLRLVREKLNPQQRVLGVLATKFHARSRANVEALAYLRGLRSVRVFEAVAPRDVRAEEAPNHGKPLALFAPGCRAARAYSDFAVEVVRLCRG